MEKYKEVLSYVVIIVVVILIRTFIATPVIVSGDSMVPNLKDNQILILSKLAKKYERFDIVVVKHKVIDQNENLVKRIIGLPGEDVEYKDNKLYINDKIVDEKFIDCETADFNLASLGYLEIPEGYYFIMGDNRGDSLDSPELGLIPIEEIEGKIVFSLFPFNTFGIIKKAN